MIFHVRYIFSIAGILIFALAMAKGSQAERWGGTFILVAWGVVYVAQTMTGQSVPEVTFVAAVGICMDVLLACGFLWLALRFSSLWLAAAMMLQAVQLALYGSFLGTGNVRHNAYAVASNVQSGLLLLFILGATLASWRRRVLDDREHALSTGMIST